MVTLGDTVLVYRKGNSDNIRNISGERFPRPGERPTVADETRDADGIAHTTGEPSSGFGGESLEARTAAGSAMGPGGAQGGSSGNAQSESAMGPTGREQGYSPEFQPVTPEHGEMPSADTQRVYKVTRQEGNREVTDYADLTDPDDTGNAAEVGIVVGGNTGGRLRIYVLPGGETLEDVNREGHDDSGVFWRERSAPSHSW